MTDKIINKDVQIDNWYQEELAAIEKRFINPVTKKPTNPEAYKQAIEILERNLQARLKEKARSTMEMVGFGFNVPQGKDER